MDEHYWAQYYNPILDEHYAKNKWMTTTIHFWMNIIYAKNNLPKLDDRIHPVLDNYCSFC